MLKTYLKVAVRNLMKRKGNTLINVSGLALGIATAIVIVLFARNELTYDQHHENSDRTYLVYKERITPNGVQPTYDTWVPLLDRLQSEFPAVETGTRLFEAGITMEVNNQRFEEEAYYIDASYFDVFDFPLERGNNDRPFTQKNSIIISRAMATKFFGDADPIGKEIRVNFQQLYTVSGVLKDYPQNGFIGQEILLPIESDPDFAEVQNDWGGSFLFTYVTLRPKAGTAIRCECASLIWMPIFSTLTKSICWKVPAFCRIRKVISGNRLSSTKRPCALSAGAT
jgi:hypothetical protein